MSVAPPELCPRFPVGIIAVRRRRGAVVTVLAALLAAMIRTPDENDVLLGRGGLNYEHEGNGQLRRLARGRVREYRKATKKEKGAISRCALPPASR